eukprot:4679641-Heterocapsa_arctica.AAC.1
MRGSRCNCASKLRSGPPSSIGKEVEKQTQGIFPLKDVTIHKEKILKKPKCYIAKLFDKAAPKQKGKAKKQDYIMKINIIFQSQTV